MAIKYNGLLDTPCECEIDNLEVEYGGTIAFYNIAKWELTRSYKSRICTESGKPIKRFSKAYKGTATWWISSNTKTIKLVQWVSPEEYVVLKLKGLV